MNAASPILFDLDGTLLDTHDMILESMQYTINEVDGQNQNDEKLMAGVGTPLLDQMRHFTAGNKTRAEELVNIYRAYNDAIHDENIHAFPGTKEALGMLAQAGCRMGVVTSKRHWLAQRGLEICGLDSFFEFLVGSDDWPEHKPAPGPILHGCELLGIAPAQCTYIGDSPFDIQAANAAGCQSVTALWGMFTEEELAACKPDLSVHSLQDFVKDHYLKA